MTAIATRLRSTWAGLVGEAAEFAGHAARSVPGIGGALLVAYGFGLAWRPLGFIALGAFLLLLDRRVP